MFAETILTVLLWMTLIGLTTAAFVMFVCVFGTLLSFLLWPFAALAGFFAHLCDRWGFSKGESAAILPDAAPRQPLSRGLP